VNGVVRASPILLLGLLACRAVPAPVESARATLGVAVPLTGPDAPAGTAAVAGVTLAAGADVDVLPVDDTLPGAAAHLAALPNVVGVVAHVTRAAAEAQADGWLLTDLPVVIAAPGEFTSVPRVVPPIAQTARCATTFLDADFWVRTDGSRAGMTAGKVLSDTIPAHALGMDTVDPTRVASAAAGLTGRRARTVVWTGTPAAGGNFLRALRQVGFDAPFLGIGLYDTHFLETAGDAADGAYVTSEGRPARDRAFVDAYTAKYGAAPTGPAVDAYEAATLLVAAWRAAAGTALEKGAALTREGVRAALGTAVAEGANGSMYLGPDGVLQPVLCASFVVRDGAFVIERIASEADVLLTPPPPPNPRRKRRRW
jgi:branched-chain amino acid transport system substrate-binding protein